MAVLIRNVSIADDVSALVVPTKPDGSFYRYEMICDNGWSRLYDDNVVGLLTHLVPGYTRLDDAQRLTARIRHAVDMQVSLQARLNVFFAASPRSREEQAVLYGARHLPPMIEDWNCEVPLVLVDAFYAPYTHLPRPTSGIADVAMPPNLWWLRPADGDLEYLRSLHETSVIDLHMAKEDVV